MASKFIRPETVTLPISDGDTITVKKRLTYGEQSDLYAHCAMRDRDGHIVVDPKTGNPRIDPSETGRQLVLAYLLDWTVQNDGAGRVEIRGLSRDELRATIASLSWDAFVEIKNAIETHTQTLAALDAEEKKLPAGENAS